MGEKTEFVTYLKGVYYNALFLTLWNLRNFKFVRNLATVDVLGCDNNHPFLPTCCGFTTRRFRGYYISAWALCCSFRRIGQSQGLRVWNGQQVRTPRFFLYAQCNKLNQNYITMRCNKCGYDGAKNVPGGTA